MAEVLTNVKTVAQKKVAGVPLWVVGVGSVVAVALWMRLHPAGQRVAARLPRTPLTGGPILPTGAEPPSGFAGGVGAGGGVAGGGVPSLGPAQAGYKTIGPLPAVPAGTPPPLMKPSPSGAPAPLGPPSASAIQAWASGIGLPVEIGQQFVSQFGFLPQTLDQLVQWGNRVGLRNPVTGAWSLTPALAAAPSAGSITSQAPRVSIPSGSEIAAWASGIGLPVQIGQQFVSQFGRLPTSLDQLISWANSVGLRNPVTGAWQPGGGGAAQPPSAPSAVPSGAAPGAPSLADITNWARGIGLSVTLGQTFVQQHGFLPQTLDQLVSWGNSTGLRNPTTGAWRI